MERVLQVILVGLIFTAGLNAPSPADQINSLFSNPDRSTSPEEKGGLKTSSATPSGSFGNQTNITETKLYREPPKKMTIKSSWITVAEPQPKAFHIHDLITIVVHEVSKHTTKADTKADRDMKAEATLADWISLTGGDLRPDKQSNGDPKISMSMNREFEGKSDIKREDTLSTRIQAEIIDIYPNGNLLLEAVHKVTTDEETTTITLTGICRSQDIGVDNTIISSSLANLNVAKQHTGIAYDTNKRGWMWRFLDTINPF